MRWWWHYRLRSRNPQTRVHALNKLADIVLNDWRVTRPKIDDDVGPFLAAVEKITPFVVALSDPQADVRCAALAAITTAFHAQDEWRHCVFGMNAALARGVLATLDDPDQRVVETAIRLASQSGRPAAIESLLRAAYRHPRLMSEVITSLERFGPAANAALIAALPNVTKNHRVQIIRHLRDRGVQLDQEARSSEWLAAKQEAESAAIAELAHELKEQSAHRRQQASEKLARFGTLAVTDLVDAGEATTLRAMGREIVQPLQLLLKKKPNHPALSLVLDLLALHHAIPPAPIMLAVFRQLNPYSNEYRRVIALLGQTRDSSVIESLLALLLEHLGPSAHRKEPIDWVLHDAIAALETIGWCPTDPIHFAARHLVREDWKQLGALGAVGQACLQQEIEKRRRAGQGLYPIGTGLKMAETGDPDFIPILLGIAQSERNDPRPMVQAIEKLLEQAAERASDHTLAIAAAFEGAEIWSELKMWEGDGGLTYTTQKVNGERIQELARREMNRRGG